jgi:hypothetical protein
MANFMLCACGQQVDTADKQPGDVVVCPGCGCNMPISGASPEEFARQLAETANKPGMFAHIQLDDTGSTPQRAETSPPQPEPAGWFRRLLRRLGLG